MSTFEHAPQHNFGLDLVRAGAILAVLFSHTAEWFCGPGMSTTILAFYMGSTGVEVLFSLSGFLIGRILLRLLDRQPIGGLRAVPSVLGQFWARRWMRTLPAYWVLVGGMCWWFGAEDWRSLLFLQNFQPMAQWAPLTPHTWSLVLEEWFYLFVPPMVLVTGALLPRQSRTWAVPLVCVPLMLACTVLRAVSFSYPDSAFWGNDLTINPLLRLDCAGWGMLAAWAVWRQAGRLPDRRLARCWLGIGLAMLAGLGLFSALTFFPERIPDFVHWAFTWIALRTSMLEFAAACVLVGLSDLWPLASGRGAWLVRAIAALSYALYLVHVPVIYFSHQVGLVGEAGWGARAGIATLVVAAAFLMRLLVERPALAIRDRLLPERQRSVMALP